MFFAPSLGVFCMEKDFSTWHNQKTRLQVKMGEKIYFKEREVWWCAIGLNLGYEQDGKGEHFLRPVLILRKFNQFTFLGVPLSTTKKEGKYFYHFAFLPSKKSVALISQVRTLDAKRLVDKLGVVSLADFYVIKKTIKDLF